MKKGIFVLLAVGNLVHAGSPVWTFTPLSPTSISVPSNGTAVVEYSITNQSRKTHTLVMNSMKGVTQDTSGSNCKNPFTLGYQQSCNLKLNITGSQLVGNINTGPVVCENGGQRLQCYQPSAAQKLSVTLAPAVTTAILSISHSPLHLVQNGHSGFITVNNTSSELSATNVSANLTGTVLENYVTVDSSNCVNIPALGSCNLVFSPVSGAPVISETNFPIQGTNTTTEAAAIIIQAGVVVSFVRPTTSTTAGGTGVSIIGTGFSGANVVTFRGVPATNIQVINSRTIRAVTPPGASGPADVQVDTPFSSGSLSNGFTYAASAIGQPTQGGVIACLNSQYIYNNLIVARENNSNGIQWGGYGTDIPSAQSQTYGFANTTAIVSTLGSGTYAAQLCANYAVDAFGNRCAPGSSGCIDGWFLPAMEQLNCLYTNRLAIRGFAASNYWSSNNYGAYNAQEIDFSTGYSGYGSKSASFRVRCVRNFTP